MRTTQDPKVTKQTLIPLMLGVSNTTNIPPDLAIQLSDIKISLDQNISELQLQLKKSILWKELIEFLKPYEKNLAKNDTQSGLDAIFFIG